MNNHDNKTRLLYVYKTLLFADKPMSMCEIKSKLYRDCDITANRKTLYDDLNTITLFENLQYFPKQSYMIVKKEREENA